MHLTQIGYIQQYQLRDATGRVLWYGTAIIGQGIRPTSTDAAAIAIGTAVVIDGPGSTFGRPGFISTTAAETTQTDPDSLVLAMKQVSSGAVGFLGFTVQPVAIGGTGLVAGMGSMGSVLSDQVAIAVGSQVVASATAKMVAAAATKSATVPAYGTVLGVCIKAAAQIGTATPRADAVGVMVAPA
jgi:hypothetical protein